jgi:hypothetical protein
MTAHVYYSCKKIYIYCKKIYIYYTNAKLSLQNQQPGAVWVNAEVHLAGLDCGSENESEEGAGTSMELVRTGGRVAAGKIVPVSMLVLEDPHPSNLHQLSPGQLSWMVLLGLLLLPAALVELAAAEHPALPVPARVQRGHLPAH